ncbi:MAG: thioesterase [Flavobacteriales bacterium]
MNLSEKQQKIRAQILSPFKFGLFKISKLPLTFLSGIKATALSPTSATTSVKYGYLNTNPFKSIYYGVLAMTAELSTGILAIFSIGKYEESISLLVIESNGKFHKKATGKIKFTCNEGVLFQEALEKCIQENIPVTVSASTKGFNEQNELVCEYTFTLEF